MDLEQTAQALLRAHAEASRQLRDLYNLRVQPGVDVDFAVREHRLISTKDQLEAGFWRLWHHTGEGRL
jgi:hypothetical protein